MTENGVDERKALGKYVRSQARHGYGTAATSTRKSPNVTQGTKFIKHMVSSTDTLMGIALKYNVTVEQIKRANTLWTNDSLFLREHLLIPLTRDNENDISHDAVVVVSDHERSASHPAKSDDEAVHEKTESSGMDFLKKYDSTIAQLKSSVEKMEQNARFLDGIEDNPLTLLPNRRRSRQRQPDRQHSVSLDDPNSPVLVIRTNTQSRHVQDTLEGARKANDELFEL